MIPLIVNNPEPMVKVRVMTVKDYSEKTTKTLHRIGVLQIEEGKELKPADKTAIELEHREVSELLTFVDDVLSYTPPEARVSLEEDVEVIYTRPFSEIGNEVRLLYQKINQLRERIVKLSDEVQQLIELKRYLEPLAVQTDLKLGDLRFSGGYLFSRVFVLSNETYKGLHDELKNYSFENVVATVEGETVFHVVARVKDQKTIETLVTNVGGKIIKIPEEDLTLRDFLEITSAKIRALEEELTRLQEELQGKVKGDLNRLTLLREALSAENERLSVLEKASEAKYVTLIEGWIPENSAESLVSEVKESIDYVFIDTRKPEEKEEPPTKQKNLARIKPFQTIVNLFGIPKYRAWDPTPIVAYSFAFFFALMTNDVVYALGIILIGKFLLPKLVDDTQTEGFRLFQRLIYTCGVVSLIFGLISGTYLGDIYTLFGFENVAISRSISEALSNPLSFIVLALIIGLVHINIGHFLAFAWAIKQRDRVTVLNKVGIFTLQLGIPSILHSMMRVNFPILTPQLYNILLYVMLAGIMLVIITAVKQKGGLGVVMGFLDIIGLFGDTLSYARLAGVGLATYYLAFCFNQMSTLFSGLFSGFIPGVFGAIIGSIVAVAILVIGHVINSVLAALGSFVHSLRLCFVEFLLKFYEGGGREYSPFRLKKRAVVSLTAKT